MNNQTIIQLATAYNTLNESLFDEILTEDFSYESQYVFTPITGKKAFIKYISQKFQAIRDSNALVFAEVASIPMRNKLFNCLIMSQGRIEDRSGLLIIQFKDNKINRLDMCFVPHWSKAIPSGKFPGVDEKYLTPTQKFKPTLENYIETCKTASSEYAAYKISKPEYTFIVDWRVKYADLDDFISADDNLLNNVAAQKFMSDYEDSGDFLYELMDI